MAMTGEPGRGASLGFLDSIKALVATAVALVHDRFELAATEFQEEMARLAAILLWALAALLLAAVGLAFVAVMILLWVAPEHRALVAGVMAALVLAGAAGAWWNVRRILGAKPRAFDASLTEFEKDRESLRSGR
jgi:uncharacterized membrane protein YqjE